MALQVQEHGQRIRRVNIVIHDQYASGRGFELRRLDSCEVRARDAREPELERRTLSQARAAGGYFASMHGHQALDEREPDAQSPLRPIECAVALYEEVKDSRQQLGGKPGAGVGDLNDGSRVLCPCAYPNLSAHISVLGRIREDIAHALDQAGEVTVHAERFIARSYDRELLLLVAQLRADGFDRLGNHARKIKRTLI